MMQSVRKGSRTTSKMASWDNFIKYYDLAYSQAVELASKRMSQLMNQEQ